MNEIKRGHRISKSKSDTTDSESSTITSIDSGLSSMSTESSSDRDSESSGESSSQNDSESSSENDSESSTESSSDNEDDVILPITEKVDLEDRPEKIGNQESTSNYSEVIAPDLENGGNHCIICLETENLRTDLCSCGASYHEKCWNEWLKKDSSCPSCRKGQTPLISDMFMRSFVDYGNTARRQRNVGSQVTIDLNRIQQLERRCYYLKLTLILCLLIFLFCYFFLIL